MKSSRHTFEIILASEAGASFDEATRALRAFLKMAGRSYRLKCLSAVEIKHGAEAAPQDDVQPTNGGERDE